MPDEATAPSVRAQRFQWLDSLRGFALICMASYHFLFDLALFEYITPGFPEVGWPKIYARTIASTFLFLAGFSLVLAHGRAIRWPNFWKRLAMILGGAALVSAASVGLMFALGLRQALIYFGILHEIAFASLVGLVFLRVPWPLTVVIAAFFAVIPNTDYFQYLQSDIFNAPWLWWTGLSTQPRSSFDFVPAFPWLGPFLFGIAIGRIDALNTWLAQRKQRTTLANRHLAPLAFLGRHSLVFYLVHQPILYGTLYVFSLVFPPPTMTPEEKFTTTECRPGCVAQRDEKFCQKFCGCTLERLQQTKLLVPFQSGAMSADDDQRLKDIANECTLLSE